LLVVKNVAVYYLGIFIYGGKMKTKHFFNAVIAALIAVIFLVVAGCATNNGPGNGGPMTQTADASAPGAEDLVRALGGKAKVEGGTVVLTDTVILTEYVRLENTALTVPEGVTLDLTAEGAGLELRDGAVLTVNGTVNATGHGDHGKGWVEGSLRIGDGTATINGSGTIYLKSKGRLLNIGSDKALRKLTLDGVTLVGLPDNDSSLVGIGEGGELVLKSGAITGNTRTSGESTSGGGVEVWRGKFTMEGGEISGNSATASIEGRGGGVSVDGESVFTMKGGTISSNSASSDGRGAGGGGVVVYNGTFTMEDGAISGNKAAGKNFANGGGVEVMESSTFTMKGGIISDNSAICSNDMAKGGGVRVSSYGQSVTFIMEGGTISGNSATGKWGQGGGVYDDGTFILKGGRIQGGTASDGFAANTGDDAALHVDNYEGNVTANWGTGGAYTKGGVSQTGGSDIVKTSGRYNQGGTDDTLIAAPGK
jgi:hypothetical protein